MDERYSGLAVKVGLNGMLRIFFTIPRSPLERFLAPAAWAIVIFIVSSLPASTYPTVAIPFADKIVHLFLYGPLGFWLARAFARTACPYTIVTGEGYAFLLGALYGLTDEFHQIFVPQRTFSMADWAIDCVALLVGIFLWRIFSLRLSPSSAD